MITATISEAFTAVLEGATPGIAAHLTVEVYDPASDSLLYGESGAPVS